MAALGVHALLARHYWFVSDDAYISFRYARMWAEGHGLRFNHAGPPVEGFSNPLWVALEAVLHAAGLDLPAVMPLVCFAVSATLVGLGAWALRRGLGLQRGAAAAGLALLAASPALAVWGSSGLETGALALAMLAAWSALVLRPRPALAGLALATVVLLRTEGLAWALVVVLAAAVAGKNVRSALAVTLGVAAASLGLRAWWFGEFMGNTAVAKVSPSVEVLQRGLVYVASTLHATPAVVVALLAAGALLLPLARSLRLDGDARLALAALVPPAAAVAEAVVVGGDFMAFGRLLLPAWPFLALVLGLALRRAAPAPTTAAIALVLLLQALAVADRVPAHPAWNFRGPGHAGLSETAMWRLERDQVGVLIPVGRGLAAALQPGRVAVIGALGAVAWEAPQVDFLDQYGLVTPQVARRPVTTLRFPGHDKAVEHWAFIDQQPDVLFATSVVGDGLRDALRPYVRDLVARGLADRYAPWVLRLRPDTPEGHPRFLFAIRRAADPDRAWAGFEAALADPASVPEVHIGDR